MEIELKCVIPTDISIYWNGCLGHKSRNHSQFFFSQHPTWNPTVILVGSTFKIYTKFMFLSLPPPRPLPIKPHHLMPGLLWQPPPLAFLWRSSECASPQICHFDIRINVSWKAFKKKQTQENTLSTPSPLGRAGWLLSTGSKSRLLSTKGSMIYTRQKNLRGKPC